MNDDILNLYKTIQSQQKSEIVQPKTNSFSQPNTPFSSSQLSQIITSKPANHLEQSESSFKRNYSANSDQFLSENALTMKRKREKCSKGLRHFSMKVCEKVKQKNVTSYNEVADELVNEYCGSDSFNSGETNATSSQQSTSASRSSLSYWSYDQKNVRRRVYDALNVLMAMNIISKEKKEIKWIGLPCNKKQECQDLETEKKKKLERIEAKCEQLKDLILEQIALKSLIERNRNFKQDLVDKSATIKLPFIVLNTDKKTNVDFTISSDKKEYVIQFDNTFELNTHFNILKRINLTNTSQSNDLIPKVFEPYLKQLIDDNTKLQPIKLAIDIPNYQNLVHMEKDLLNIKIKKKKATANSGSTGDLVNEMTSMFEDEEDQMSNEENEEESEEDDLARDMDQNTDDENTTENDEDEEEEENSIADSISF